MQNNEYYIWPAGTYGRRLINFFRNNAPEAKFIGFIDNNPEKQRTPYQGLPVISWEEAKQNIPKIKVVVSMSLPTEIRDFLIKNNYIENEDFFTDFTFIPRYFWETKKRIVTPNLMIGTNNSCICNCDGCYAYIPYVKKPIVYPLDNLSNTIDLMFNHIDKCEHLNIVGGETFLNKDVSDFCVYLRDNYSDRFGTMSVTTSGLLVPSDDEMKKFASANVEFSISDYTKIDKRAKNSLKILIEKCNEYDILWYRDRQSDREIWFDMGNPYEINITDPDELRVRFKKCFKPIASCIDGELFGCLMQHWRWLATGISEPHDDDYFNLSQEVTSESRELLYRIISQQPEKGYYTGCAHCGGTFTPYLK